MRGWVIACMASVSAAAAAAQDVRPMIGPFALGSSIEEARRAAPEAAWRVLNDSTTGRLKAVAAANAWTFDKQSFNLTLTPDSHGTRSLKFESGGPSRDRDECEKRVVALVADFEGRFGEMGPGPSALGWGAGDASVGAASFSQVAVAEELPGTYWYAETLEIEKPHYVVVSASFAPVAKRCAVEISATTELPRPSAPGTDQASAAVRQFGAALANRVEPAFAAEFKDGKAARAAWRRRGRPALLEVAHLMFPAPSLDMLPPDAVAAVRAKRTAEPSASVEMLVETALSASGIVIVPPFDSDKARKIVEGFVPDATIQRGRDVAVLKIPVLAQKTAAQVGSALSAMPDRLIVDLRANAGGDFETLVGISEPFLQPSAVVVSVVRRDGTSDYLTPGPEGSRRRAAIAVLVDEGTSAYALVLAAALVDHTKAKLAGRLPDRIDGMLRANVQRPIDKNLDKASIDYPVGVLKRPNGALLADGLKLDLPSTATGDAAITEVMKAFK